MQKLQKFFQEDAEASLFYFISMKVEIIKILRYSRAVFI